MGRILTKQRRSTIPLALCTMTPEDSRSPLDSVLLWLSRLLAVAAVGLSGYLLYAGMQLTTVAGCDYFSGFDCDAALASRWAKWFGVPVSAFGALTYLAILSATFLIGVRAAAPAGWRIIEAGAVAALGSAAWFMAVQVAALDSFCLYCVLTHVCGVVCATLLLFVRWRQTARVEAPAAAALMVGGVSEGPAGPPPLGAPLAAGVLGVSVLVAGQLFGAAPGPKTAEKFEAPADLEVSGFDQSTKADEPAAEATTSVADEPETQTVAKPTLSVPRRRENGSRQIEFLNGRLRIDAYTHPVVGSPEAPYTVLEMMDYACPHCREFHELMTEALERRDGQIAVVVMPVPGEILCNPYVKRGAKQRRGACKIAKLSLAVSELQPASFEPMHRWLLEGDRLPNYTTALIQAQRYVDTDELSMKVRDDSGELAARVKRHIELYATLSGVRKIGLPAQVIGNNIYAGGIDTVDSLLEIWDENFGLEPEDFGESGVTTGE